MKPAPYGPDTLAKGWRFELDYEKIERSDTWAIAPKEARPWLLMMWMVAWKQAPCGSLPQSEAVIAGQMDMPAEKWAQYREVLMRGWWLADDGRLYHDTLAMRVGEMMSRRRSDADRQAQRRQREASKRSEAAEGGAQASMTTEAAAAKAPDSTGHVGDVGLSVGDVGLSVAVSPPCVDGESRTTSPVLTLVSRVTPPGLTPESSTGTGTREKKEKPPHPPAGGARFPEFWAEWPEHCRKVAEGQCARRWRRAGLDSIADRVMAGLRAHVASEQWRKQGGEFIPAPLAWLKQERWLAPALGASAASVTVPPAETVAQYLARVEAERRRDAQGVSRTVPRHMREFARQLRARVA